MNKPERRCPPYEGSDPYLYLCFAEADSEAVFPLLQYLYERGVRIWYTSGVTDNIEKLKHQHERMKNASLLVIYLTENARRDERVKNSLIYYQSKRKTQAVLENPSKLPVFYSYFRNSYLKAM